MLSGILADPYSGRSIAFIREAGTSADVQIGHVVALAGAVVDPPAGGRDRAR
ncbi:hypothetical protein [Kineococcus radiotolerans]|uniref:hypothetical protein n=1 Tax=Kineococcus radiotolerans TaxID=131568 RepID=UPI000053C384|nr:hypothetical protein [Kineococcus radiotolerans]